MSVGVARRRLASFGVVLHCSALFAVVRRRLARALLLARACWHALASAGVCRRPVSVGAVGTRWQLRAPVGVWNAFGVW
eukprot:11216463-Lingulodinium_polyedra.AAC.1